MSQNKGWFKQYRANLMQFSTDPLLNISLHNLFTYLCSNAVWNDFDDLKRGQVKAKTDDIQKWMPYVNSVYIRKLIRILIDKKMITKVKSSKNELDYSIFEICNYDIYSGNNDKECVEKDRTSTVLAPHQRQLDKQLELLENNHDELTGCTSTELAPNYPPLFLFIEERNKEIKEENIGSDSQSSSPQTVNLTVVKKEKKPRTRKTTRPRVTPLHQKVFRIFEPDPRHVKKVWCDKSAIFFAVDEFLEKYGDLAKPAIENMYSYFRENDLCGKQQYSIAFVESVLKDAIEIELEKRNSFFS